MRLLNTSTKQLESFYARDVPAYAILSHLWGVENDEVLFKHIAGSDDERREGEQRKGYAKIVAACKQAIKDGWEYIWIDTCCINKESSAELSEAINSMYQWYRESRVCYAYLEDIRTDGNNGGLPFGRSKWFLRGWTLQELIAPRHVVFYSGDWVDIGTKASLQDIISNVTRIRVEMITGYDPKKASVAERMSWAAFRQTTRAEDEAYCLMGMFEVNMPLLYGEGRGAFMRLQEEIMKRSDDHSIFAWKGNYNTDMQDIRGLLADSPWNFRDAGNIIQSTNEGFRPPYSMTNRGLQIQLPLQLIKPKGNQIDIASSTYINLDQHQDIFRATLTCTYGNKKTTRWVVIYLKKISEGYFVRIFPHWLDETDSNPTKQELTLLLVKQIHIPTTKSNPRQGFKIKVLPTESGFTIKDQSLANGYEYYYDDNETHETFIFFTCEEKSFGVAIGTDNGVPWLCMLWTPFKPYFKGSHRNKARARHLDRLFVNVSDDWSMLVSAKEIHPRTNDWHHTTLFEVVINIFQIQAGRVEERHVPLLMPTSNTTNLDLLNNYDPHNVHPEFKKEGSDWFAIFNPKVKELFDVGLVHDFRDGSVACARFSSDGRYLATGCNGAARIYDMSTGVKIWSSVLNYKSSIYRKPRILCVCFSPSNELLATCTDDNRIRIWNITKERKHISNDFNGHQGQICSIEFSFDSRFIVSGCSDGTVRIWTIADGTSKILTIDDTLKPTQGVIPIALSPDGPFIATGSSDGIISVWDMETMKPLAILQGHRHAVLSITFTPNGKGLVSGDSEGALKYWDIGGLTVVDDEGVKGDSRSIGAPVTHVQEATAKLNQWTTNFAGHQYSCGVSSVAVSHDGCWIITGLESGSLQFSDSSHGIGQFRLQGHHNTVTSIHMSPVGNIFATCDSEQIRICPTKWTRTVLTLDAGEAHDWIESLSVLCFLILKDVGQAVVSRKRRRRTNLAEQKLASGHFHVP